MNFIERHTDISQRNCAWNACWHFEHYWKFDDINFSLDRNMSRVAMHDIFIRSHLKQSVGPGRFYADCMPNNIRIVFKMRLDAIMIQISVLALRDVFNTYIIASSNNNFSLRFPWSETNITTDPGTMSLICVNISDVSCRYGYSRYSSSTKCNTQ